MTRDVSLLISIGRLVYAIQHRLGPRYIRSEEEQASRVPASCPSAPASRANGLWRRTSPRSRRMACMHQHLCRAMKSRQVQEEGKVHKRSRVPVAANSLTKGSKEKRSIRSSITAQVAEGSQRSKRTWTITTIAHHRVLDGAPAGRPTFIGANRSWADEALRETTNV